MRLREGGRKPRAGWRDAGRLKAPFRRRSECEIVLAVPSDAHVRVRTARPQAHRLPRADSDKRRIIEENQFRRWTRRLHRQSDCEFAWLLEPVESRKNAECRADRIVIVV